MALVNAPLTCPNSVDSSRSGGIEPVLTGTNARSRRGVTDVPGLYFLGLTWQYTRGSALIGWVQEDAEFIAERIAAYQARPSVRTPVGVGASAQARSDERS